MAKDKDPFCLYVGLTEGRGKRSGTFNGSRAGHTVHTDKDPNGLECKRITGK